MIPYDKILKRQKRYSKIRCEKCGKVKMYKHMAVFKGRVLCSNCKPNIIGGYFPSKISKLKGIITTPNLFGQHGYIISKDRNSLGKSISEQKALKLIATGNYIVE